MLARAYTQTWTWYPVLGLLARHSYIRSDRLLLRLSPPRGVLSTLEEPGACFVQLVLPDDIAKAEADLHLRWLSASALTTPPPTVRLP